MDERLVELEVKNLSRLLAFEVSVGGKVWAIPTGGAVKVDLADKTARQERFQTIIYSSERNGRKLMAYSG
jgi:hypothetical protein